MARLRKTKMTLGKAVVGAILLLAAAFAAWAVLGDKPFEHLRGVFWGGCACSQHNDPGHEH